MHRWLCPQNGGSAERLQKGPPRLLAGKVTLELYEALTAIQQQSSPDPFGWVVPVV